MKRKVLAIISALVLFMAMLPSEAFAALPEETVAPCMVKNYYQEKVSGTKGISTLSMYVLLTDVGSGYDVATAKIVSNQSGSPSARAGIRYLSNDGTMEYFTQSSWVNATGTQAIAAKSATTARGVTGYGYFNYTSTGYGSLPSMYTLEWGF